MDIHSVWNFKASLFETAVYLALFLAKHQWNKSLPHKLPVPFSNAAMKSLCHPLTSHTSTKIIYEKLYNTTNVEIDFPIRNAWEMGKKYDNTSLGK